MNHLRHLQAWFEGHHEELESSGLVVALDVGPEDRDKRAAWVDIDSSERLVRFTLWESGEATLSVLEMSSARLVAEEQLEITNGFGLAQALRDAVAWARGR